MPVNLACHLTQRGRRKATDTQRRTHIDFVGLPGRCSRILDHSAREDDGHHDHMEVWRLGFVISPESERLAEELGKPLNCASGMRCDLLQRALPPQVFDNARYSARYWRIHKCKGLGSRCEPHQLRVAVFSM